MYADWHATISRLQALVNASATGLPPYDVRKAQAGIDALAIAAEETRGRVLPRKKFTFSRQTQTKRAATIDNVSDREARDAPIMHAGPTVSDTDAANEDDYTISHRTGETIIVTPQQLSSHFSSRGGCSGGPSGALSVTGDLRLLELTDCVVLLLAPMRALRVDKLTRCAVLAGPVAGSLLLHDCADCTLAVASRQVRLHRSTRCDLYLRPCSRPIVEHCTGLRIGPCGVAYPGIEEHLAASGLGAALAAAEARVAASSEEQSLAAGVGSGPIPLWRSVDDFGWLRMQASPNWSAGQPHEWMVGAASHQGTDGSREALGSGLRALPGAAVAAGVTVRYDGAWIGDGHSPAHGGSAGDEGGTAWQRGAGQAPATAPTSAAGLHAAANPSQPPPAGGPADDDDDEL